MNKQINDSAKRAKMYNLSRKKLLMSSSPYELREAYTQLRTNLLFSVAASSDNQCRTFLITSPNASEGKSLTTANIAISFAMLGKKTLLIDCDMRKPTQHRLWNTDNSNGLSNLLTSVGKCIIHDVKGLPLSILHAGDIPPNPSELLSSKRFPAALEYLKKAYSYIVIDLPPVNVVSDAQIISRYADGVVMVVRSGATRSEDVIHAEEAIKRADGKLCGVVVNGMNLSKAKYSYKYKKYAYKYKTSYYEYTANSSENE